MSKLRVALRRQWSPKHGKKESSHTTAVQAILPTARAGNTAKIAAFCDRLPHCYQPF
jgi:hypothetical protein